MPVTQQWCRMTHLSLGLGTEAQVPSLACWFLSWGGSVAQVPRPYLRSPSTPGPAPSWPVDAPCTLIQEGSHLTLAHRGSRGMDMVLPSWRTGMRQGRWSQRGHKRRASGREDTHCSPSLRICPVCSPPPLRAPRGRRASLHCLRRLAEAPSTRLCPESPAPPPLLRSPRSTSVLDTNVSGAALLSRCLWVSWLRPPLPPNPGS